MPDRSRHNSYCKTMKKTLLNALKNADAELSAMGQVKIDSEVMSHISGGGYDSSGAYCTISGECNSSGNSCRGAGFIINLLTGEIGNPVMPKR